MSLEVFNVPICERYYARGSQKMREGSNKRQGMCPSGGAFLELLAELKVREEPTGAKLGVTEGYSAAWQASYRTTCSLRLYLWG